MNKNLRVETLRKNYFQSLLSFPEWKWDLVVKMFQSDPMLENIIKAAHLYLLLPLVMIIRN